MASQQHYKIELVEENEKVNFYSHPSGWQGVDRTGIIL